jgi:hypothetical protein
MCAARTYKNLIVIVPATLRLTKQYFAEIKWNPFLQQSGFHFQDVIHQIGNMRSSYWVQTCIFYTAEWPLFAYFRH